VRPEGRSEDEATRLVLGFLEALERRDLAAAGAALAPGTGLTFPGGVRHASLEAMVEAARGRYRRIGKIVESVEAFAAGGAGGAGPTGTAGEGAGRAPAGSPAAELVVYVRGTLHGENLHGVPFEGVRFIDRFEVAGGRIVDQQVWNDLAESGVLTRRG